MNQTAKFFLITLSMLALFNVMFVPIFDVWGGLFPKDTTHTFFDVMEIVFIDVDTDAWSLWVVQLTMSIFIPSILMLFASLIESKVLFITFNVVGIFLLSEKIYKFIQQHSDLNNLFSDDCCLSIGTWIGLAIFLVSFLVALGSKKADQTF